MNPEQTIARLDVICRRARILPVITIPRAEDILPLADALAAGGLDTLEITLRSEHGLTAIRRLREQRPQLCIGVGTVLDPQTWARAVEAGAQFIVTPGCTEELLRTGLDSPVPLLPGVASASDIMLAYRLGYRRFKLFPAMVCGGVEALKAFAGPFGEARFCPTGGVGPANLSEYAALRNVMCVGGSWMLPADALHSGDWARVEQLSREALRLLDAGAGDTPRPASGQ
ncbi:bifunctional 4-hydroxy-2-oxoglutarate aldolase/2-dehydro-3-deoxy-phosphogluconate aldolase [Pseudomonas sp. RIT-PI-AD]|uniref:bifunctional 4-hydroxy-2-oxoglutarate aldolase/2-dehydro-3-deoxy-phosphogluconate aldolase n=1 Tax=Pseudomonas sp. RIT-PI-AD TaxID=3035294 RepID=UPI0021D9BDD7|nr:bifunctional 4-hydroxy-2-oxoglutarate aldolase/2-dehydro-3-deoxy-phosphogluconate aldolase [Pseudomonas sp. RIT-PI-AD]